MIDPDVMIGTPDPAQGEWTVRPLQIYAHELWCEVAALRSQLAESQRENERLRSGDPRNHMSCPTTTPHPEHGYHQAFCCPGVPS